MTSLNLVLHISGVDNAETGGRRLLRDHRPLNAGCGEQPHADYREQESQRLSQAETLLPGAYPSSSVYGSED